MVVVGMFLRLVLVCFLDYGLSHKFSGTCWFKTECTTSQQSQHRSRVRTPSLRKQASGEITSDSVKLWEAEIGFLHIPHLGTNVRLPTHREISPRSISNLQSPCCISHMTILLVFTRVMNVGDQTSEAFVTSSGPFCDCSWLFVYR